MTSENIEFVNSNNLSSIQKQRKDVIGKLAVAYCATRFNLYSSGLNKEYYPISAGTIVMIIKDITADKNKMPMLSSSRRNNFLSSMISDLSGLFLAFHDGRTCVINGDDFILTNIENCLEGKKFCIGSTLFSSHHFLKTFINLKGGRLEAFLSSSVDYLICGEQARNTNALPRQKEAMKLGIPIITEHQFYKLFDNTNNGKRPRDKI